MGSTGSRYFEADEMAARNQLRLLATAARSGGALRAIPVQDVCAAPWWPRPASVYRATGGMRPCGWLGPAIQQQKAILGISRLLSPSCWPRPGRLGQEKPWTGRTVCCFPSQPFLFLHISLPATPRIYFWAGGAGVKCPSQYTS